MSKKSKPSEPVGKTRVQGPKTKAFMPVDALNQFIQIREKQILIFLTLIALLIRLYRLGHLSFWVDEYVHVTKAVNFLRDFRVSRLFEGDNNGLLVSFFNVLGFILFGKNEFGGRIFMVLLGTALVPATYYFCKILFNRPVALLSCLLVVFSQYLIFWSRLDRQYGPLPTFYLLLILSIVTLLHHEPANSPERSIWTKYAIDKKQLGWVFLFFVLSFSTNFLSYFIVYSTGVYAIFLLFSKGILQKTWFAASNYKISLIALLSLVFFILSFTPLNQIVLKPAFSAIFSESMISMILPDLKYIKTTLFSAEKFKHFQVYWDVVNTDIPYSIYFFFGGLVSMALFNINRFVLMVSFYVLPFLLMSFVFLEPCLPRYHIFIYPLYLISVACSFYYIPKFIVDRWGSGKAKFRNYVYLGSLIALVFLFFKSNTFPNILHLINNNSHGSVIDRRLSIWYFTNWKEPSLFIKKNIRKGDVVFSTLPDAVNFYINQQEQYKVHLFRQMRLNPEDRNFVQIGNSPSLPSASSVEDLYKSMESYPRIWLIADYYIYNSLTDPKARDLVFKNFTLFPEACRDGSVQLFLWERNRPEKFPHNTLLEMGKPTGRQVSPTLSFGAAQENLSNGLSITFQSTGIDSDKEAYVQINNADHFNIPKPRQLDHNNLGVSEIRIPGNKLKLGQNLLAVKYNTTKPDNYKGFIIYNIEFK